MKKILVIDDEIKICELIKRSLEKKDYDVQISTDGVQALKKVKKEKPDIILLDIRMTGMDGLEVLWNIRNFDKEVYILIVTAINEEATGSAAKRLGANDYITKPIDLESLEKNLNKIEINHF